MMKIPIGMTKMERKKNINQNQNKIINKISEWQLVEDARSFAQRKLFIAFFAAGKANCYNPKLMFTRKVKRKLKKIMICLTISKTKENLIM